MTVIYGTGPTGQEALKNFYSEGSDVVFYNNDRRVWGQTVSGKVVINFDRLTDLLENAGAEIVFAADMQDKTAVPFLKDVCLVRRFGGSKMTS